MLAGAIIGTSVVGKGSSAYADWDDWGTEADTSEAPINKADFGVVDTDP